MTELSDVNTAEDGTRHYHWSDGQSFPSVTTVLGAYEPKKRGLANWEQKVGAGEAERIRSESALLGTLVHHRILQEVAHAPLPVPDVDLSVAYDGIMGDIQTCEMMWEKADFKIEGMPHVERALRNTEDGYSGRVDLFAGGIVADLKTSKQVRPAHRMQAASYAKAIELDPDLPDPDGAAIVQLDPDPSTNPEMTPHVERLNESQLQNLYDEFCRVLSKYKQEAQSI